MKVHFFGGAGTVTGSKYLVETATTTILVDCGMFQGLKFLRELNREPLPYLPENIDFVIITHGHLDHCGWLPVLVRNGFKGKIFCTAPTKEIIKIILLDSAKIQEEEAEKANNEHFSKHDQATPLYTVADAEAVFPFLRTIEPNLEVKITDEVYFNFFYASHILGACSVNLMAEEKTLVFSGDIGQDDDVLLFPPKKPKQADYVFLESTYGNRLHPSNNTLLEIETIINNTFHKGGNVVIPSFAVERVQTVMYLLWQLQKEERLPKMPLIIDTPMGIDVIQLFLEFRKWHKLSLEECQEMCQMFTLISDYKDTIAAIYDDRPKVVIAASGMITGGRVLSYLERYIGKPETTVLLVGYQAEGTRGRKLLEGVKEIKMYGKYYSVEANVILVEGLSAHGDQKDLLNWLSELENTPQKVFLIHGENEAADELRHQIKERYNFDCIVPYLGQVIEI
jgi:metallo-beta-lactamase family protein